MRAFCADSGPRTSACTDICALACTAKNAARISAGWKSRSPCGKPAQHFGFQNARLVSGRPADRGLPWPAAASEQPSFGEAQIALRAEHEVVVHRDVQEAPGVDELTRDG